MNCPRIDAKEFVEKRAEILLVIIETPHKLYPFQNQSFDEVVDSYLPVLNQLDNKNKENFFNFL